MGPAVAIVNGETIGILRKTIVSNYGKSVRDERGLGEIRPEHRVGEMGDVMKPHDLRHRQH
jgi:hypothetical protein